MHTVQKVDGRLIVCEIEPKLISQNPYPIHHSSFYFEQKRIDIYEADYAKRLMYDCKRIPCDSNPKWEELVNCEVVIGVDYKIWKITNPEKVKQTAVLCSPPDQPASQPVYVDIMDAFGAFFDENSVEDTKNAYPFAEYLESQGYKLVKL